MRITIISIDLVKNVFVRPASRVSLCLIGESVGPILRPPSNREAFS